MYMKFNTFLRDMHGLFRLNSELEWCLNPYVSCVTARDVIRRAAVLPCRRAAVPPCRRAVFPRNAPCNSATVP